MKERSYISVKFQRYSLSICSQLAAFNIIVSLLYQSAAQSGLKADSWVKSFSDLLEGKVGGKDLAAQGSGSNIYALDEALTLARQFAVMKLHEQ